MFILKFSTENAAFEGDLRSEEVARILRYVTQLVEDNRTDGYLCDISGNLVGDWSLTDTR